MQKLNPKRKKTMQCTFDPVLLHFISGCQQTARIFLSLITQRIKLGGKN